MARRVTRAEEKEEEGQITPAGLAAIKARLEVEEKLAKARTASQAADQSVSSQELALVQEQEARLQVVRTQEVGQIAESALVQLLTKDDSKAHAFQREHMAALRDEFAPPDSPISERLLVEIIVKARFEAQLWSERSDQMILDRMAHPLALDGLSYKAAQDAKAQAGSHARAQQKCEERALAAEKRCVGALRELNNLRRLNAPLVQVNLAHVAPGSVASAAPPHALASAPETVTWSAPASRGTASKETGPTVSSTAAFGEGENPLSDPAMEDTT